MNVHQPSKRRLKWIVGASIPLAVVIAILSMEPMRFRLPYRYLVKQIDIQRSGFIDFEMCMRVRLTAEEAMSFVSGMFEPVSSTEGTEVDMFETRCEAAFWPTKFDVRAMAYESDWSPPPYRWKVGTSGAVYQNGYLYFWSNSI